MSEEVAVLAIIWAGLSLYMLLGGADFGGGAWDLLARGPGAERQRALISEAIGPVWEANHVWLIFVLTGLLAGFPSVFADLSVALYVPFSLALVGIVLRGAAFAFRAHGDPGSAWQRRWSRVFGVASLASPFLLGAAAASIASGRIRVREGVVDAGLVGTWTGALSVFSGLFVLAMCAYLAATYLTVEAAARGARDLEELFRARALVAGLVAGALALGGLPLLRTEAPLVWAGMLRQGMPFVALSSAGGLASVWATARRRYRIARLAAAVAVGAVLWGWGAAQWPYLIVPDVTVGQAAAPARALRLVTVGYGIGALVLLPSLWLLFRVFKGARAAGC
ncbi:MAG TPA: cytochrome d ubiquinol oxidase subunit II [Actinomycetota bacterium]|nr:cytochrome d ubiquinol oxidase subunit II [Actinomycetota bacterium]